MKSDIINGMSGRSGHPPCFSRMEKVFPRADDGLRKTPETCFECIHKTVCLKQAIAGRQGLLLKEELIDRAYKAGRMNLLQRWSRKKTLAYKRKEAVNEIDR